MYIKKIKYKLNWGPMIGSVFNIGLLLTSIKVFFMILYKISGVGVFLASFLSYDDKAGCYFLINEMANYDNGTKYLWIAFAINIVFIILMLFLLAKKNIKRKLLIIEHSSLQKMGFSYDEKELEDYAYKRIPINQYETFNSGTMSINERVSSAIIEVDSKTSKILHYVDKGYQVGYAGIANIPATFMLGYELGDENKKLLFHKRRSNSIDDNFHLLSNEPRELKFIANETKNDLTKSGKILILIQLTQPIKDSDLQGVREDNDYVIKYEIPQTISYDVVDSGNQANEYTNKVLSDICEIQKNPSITQIKICIAASGAFVFALGTKFSKTQNKDTVIFHYQQDSYPWGINVTKKKPVVIKGV